VRHGHVVLGGRTRRRGAREADRPADRQRLRARPRRGRPRPPPPARRPRPRVRRARRTSAVTTAARELAAVLVRSGARRVAFLGLAKNVGKTTALVTVLAELHASRVAAGATSAGRDGESFDATPGEPKPRFRVWKGQALASAEPTFAAASCETEPVEALPFRTRFGPIAVRRAASGGEIEMIGPSTASQTAAAAAALERAGA